MSRMKLAGLDPSVRAAAEWALNVAAYYRVPVSIASGFRTRAEQSRLRRNYEQCLASGRFGQGPDCLYPANKPGFSAHEYGLAFDSTVDRRLMGWWAYVRRAAGFTVLQADLPHAEAPNWRDFVRLPSGSDD